MYFKGQNFTNHLTHSTLNMKDLSMDPLLGLPKRVFRIIMDHQRKKAFRLTMTKKLDKLALSAFD